MHPTPAYHQGQGQHTTHAHPNGATSTSGASNINAGNSNSGGAIGSNAQHNMAALSQQPGQHSAQIHHDQLSSTHPGPQSASTNVQGHSLAGRKSSMGMLQAVGYLRKIQERFFKQPEVYQAFVDILRAYQKEQRPIKEVYRQVAILFAGHQDILEEFSQFIPDMHGGAH